MNQHLANYLHNVGFGEFQTYKELTIVPIVSKISYDFKYLTLKQAFENKAIIIQEVNDSGIVSKLKVVNKSGLPVLLLSGEELSGAKQNRIINTTILLKEHSETIIPVSCTEQGRWNYETEEFSESGHISFHKLRSSTQASVSESLQDSGSFDSDQMNVWSQVRDIEQKMECHSPTSAMKDVIDGKKESIDEYFNI
jgi:hypothetical protein